MTDHYNEISSILTNACAWTKETADFCQALLTECGGIAPASEYVENSRVIILNEDDKNCAKGTSYHLRNIVFNFRKAALESGIKAIDTYFVSDSLMNGRDMCLYALLLLLKIVDALKVKLDIVDAELIGYLWQERSQRKLFNAEKEYDIFNQYRRECDKRALTYMEFNEALNRLADLKAIEIEDGAILLRERVLIR